MLRVEKFDDLTRRERFKNLHAERKNYVIFKHQTLFNRRTISDQHGAARAPGSCTDFDPIANFLPSSWGFYAVYLYPFFSPDLISQTQLRLHRYFPC
jgi:hypothetical protein